MTDVSSGLIFLKNKTKQKSLPSILHGNETHLRANSHLLVDITWNKNSFLSISLAFQFLFGLSGVEGKEPMFVGSNRFMLVVVLISESMFPSMCPGGVRF